jgi:hypothetical protein
MSNENSVELRGDKELQEKIKKLSDASRILDPAFKATSTNSLRRLIQTTNRQSETTARNWRAISLGLSSYQVVNDTTTDDKKHLIVNILNEGRGEVFPVKAKALYIPLTDKGRAKDKDAEFGIDFVMAKSARAFAGTNFLWDELAQAGAELQSRVMDILKGA